MRLRNALLTVAALLAIVVTACSPESERTRGGGSGADIGNWGHPVRLHGDASPSQRIYYDVPDIGKGIQTSGSATGIYP